MSLYAGRLFCSGDDSQGPKEFGKYFDWPNIPAICADEPAKQVAESKSAVVPPPPS